MTATEELAESQSRLQPKATGLDRPAPEKLKEAPPAEELDASMAHFRKVMLDGMPEKKREAKPESDKLAPNVKPEKPEKPPVKPEPEAAPEPEKKAVKVTRKEKAEPPAARSMEDVAAEAAARTVAAMRPAAPEREPAKEAPVPKEYVKQMAVFTEMAADSPERHGELPEKLKRFIAKEDAYIQKWQEENPGSDFDSNDEAHNDFYRRNEPTYDEDDYDSARTKIAAKPLLEKEGQKIRGEMGERLKRLDEIEAKEIERELVPKIVAEQKGVMAKLLGAIDQDYAARAEKPEEIEKLATENPPAYRLVMETAKHTLPFVAEVVKLWDSDSKIKANMENPLHRHIYDYERHVAARVKALDKADQVNPEGQTFASWAEYQTMSAAEQKKHWIMGRNELIFARQKDAIDAISGVIELATGLSKRNGNGTVAALATQTEKPAAPPPKPAPQAETSSPTMAGKQTISTTGDPGVKTSDNWADVFNKTLAGRKF